MINKLPASHLIQVLKKKSDGRTDVEFDYVSELNDLRKRIGAEVRFINQLFPEYTPHDEEYHLSRLFHVADILIEKKRYEAMNASELFVLACGLYGHDWGMAVNEPERDYIISGEVPSGFSASDFALLHDEHSEFRRYAKDSGLDEDEIKKNGVAMDIWREYVRKTHALRSGARLRHYFQEIASGVGEAAARVAEGHWLNIEDLEDPRRFPTNFSVLLENIDLVAIAIYVRLVDLLDIGHDRTPYVIWKFVAPRNAYSKMEWQKHRALQPITCPPYLKGRVIVVDGSTDDHEVFAALEDLHNYCDKQLRESLNLLSRIPDERDLLDVYHIEWRVVANGFDPVLVRFEFDRERVFEILSNEIYQGDAYVFLRELLQNSIDAIRTRREFLQRAGIMPHLFGLIKVDVQHQPNGDITITWTDDGIGIDEHVLRNYLAVAGRSYYQSKDFEREGLSFDPISRFGVGILSCFMACDVIEIETQKDPYAFSAMPTALRVRIPSVTGQFRVEKTLPHDFGVGTRIRLFIDGKKLPQGFDNLEVTRYLEIVGGFSQFPIVVFEKGRYSVVLHPDSPIDVDSDPRLSDVKPLRVRRIELGYPWHDAILPQDVEPARSLLMEETVDIREDLGLDFCEGRLTYLGVRDRETLITSRNVFGEGFAIGNKKDLNQVAIRWASGWGPTNRENEDKWVKSASPQPALSVYRDGILIPGAQLKRPDSYPSVNLPRRHVVINLWKSAPALSISRTHLLTNQDNWFDPIESALNKFFQKRLADALRDLEGMDRFGRLGMFAGIFDLREAFLEFCDQNDFPVPSLDGKLLNFEPRSHFSKQAFRVMPSVLGFGVGEFLEATHEDRSYVGYMNWWRGNGAVIEADSDSMAIDRSLFFLKLLMRQTHVPKSVVLLKGPTKSIPQIAQEVWEPKCHLENISINELLLQGMERPHGLSPEQRDMILSNYEHAHFRYDHSRFLEFPVAAPPVFRAGSNLHNLNHPLATLLFRCLCYQELHRTEQKGDEISLGRLTDALDRFESWRLGIYSDVRESAEALVDAAKGVGLKVPTQVTLHSDELWYPGDDEYELHVSLQSDCTEEFGYEL
jgi:Histidine kinase-, DNA gyrase B-, and HSP90-like ATPase